MSSANVHIRRELSLDHELASAMLQDSELVQSTDDCKNNGQPVAGFRPKPCCTLGVCICQQAQRDVPFFIANLTRYFRTVFTNRNKVRSEARKLLDQFSIVLQLTWTKPSQDGVDDAVARRDRDDVSTDLLGLEDLYEDALALPQRQLKPEPEFSSLYFHIGWANLQTFHLSMLQLASLDNHQPLALELEGLDDDVQVLTPLPADPLSSNQNGIYTLTEAALKLMDLHFAWKVSVLQFACEIGSWCFHHDGSIAVKPISHCPSFMVWQGATVESQRRAITRKQSQATQGNRKRAQGAQAKPRRKPASSPSALQQARKRMKPGGSKQQKFDSDSDKDELLLLLEEMQEQEQGFNSNPADTGAGEEDEEQEPLQPENMEDPHVTLKQCQSQTKSGLLVTSDLL